MIGSLHAYAGGFLANISQIKKPAHEGRLILEKN
jgi:hypothetical protein